MTVCQFNEFSSAMILLFYQFGMMFRFFFVKKPMTSQIYKNRTKSTLDMNLNWRRMTSQSAEIQRNNAFKKMKKANQSSGNEGSNEMQSNNQVCV